MSGLDSEIWDREYQTEEEIEAQLNGNSMYEDQDEEFYEDFIEEYDEDDMFEQAQSVMDRATVRLEQGKLYNMLIQHSLFEGVDADPQAIANVESEIREFIVERLEVLLGMRAEKETQVQQIVQQPQFNDMEVQALKMMANKVTKGASANAPTSQPETTSLLNTVKKQKPEQKINALGGQGKKIKKPVQQTPVQNKQLRTKPQQKPQRKLKKEIAQVSTQGLSVEQAAKRDLEYVENLKGMSVEEANKIVSQRHKRPIPKSNMTQEAINAHYQGQMSMNETAQTFTALLAAAKKV